MSIGNRLRHWRQVRQLTQPELAERAGIEQSYLSKLENHRSIPSDAVLERLADALAIDTSSLLEASETQSMRPIWWLLAGGLLFISGFGSGAIVYWSLQAERLEISKEDLLSIRDRTPDGVFVDETEIIGRRVLRVSGRYTNKTAVMQYASQLLGEGRFGTQLHKLVTDENRFHFDLGMEPPSKSSREN